MQSSALERGIDVWLIHGLGDSPRVWRGVRKDLKHQGHRLMAPTLPGFGGTPPLEGRQRGLEGLARWLEARIARRSRGRHVALVGHSMGGMIGTLVAAHMPDLIGLINIEGPLTLADCDTSRKAAESRDFTRWFRVFRRAVRAPGSGAPPHYGAGIDETDVPSFRAYAKDIVALARGARIGKFYASLRVPHIFFYGGAPGGMSRRSLAFLKTHGCETAGFTAAAHWPMTETRLEFSRALILCLDLFDKGPPALKSAGLQR
jgi:pimeloyl-ACP methyl ester carboxylesterase